MGHARPPPVRGAIRARMGAGRIRVHLAAGIVKRGKSFLRFTRKWRVMAWHYPAIRRSQFGDFEIKTLQHGRPSGPRSGVGRLPALLSDALRIFGLNGHIVTPRSASMLLCAVVAWVHNRRTRDRVVPERVMSFNGSVESDGHRVARRDGTRPFRIGVGAVISSFGGMAHDRISDGATPLKSTPWPRWGEFANWPDTWARCCRGAASILLPATTPIGRRGHGPPEPPMETVGTFPVVTDGNWKVHTYVGKLGCATGRSGGSPGR